VRSLFATVFERIGGKRWSKRKTSSIADIFSRLERLLRRSGIWTIALKLLLVEATY